MVICWLAVVLAIYHKGLFNVFLHSFLAWNVRGALLILLAAQILGWALGAALRWKPESWPEGIAFQQSAGLGLLSYTFLGMAYLHSYSPSNLEWLVNAVVLVGSLAFLYGRWRRHINPVQHRIHRLPALSSTTDCFGSQRGDAMWRLISGLALGLALCGALAPEIEPDALNYHLFLPRVWLQHRAPVDLVEDLYSLLPLTWELLYGAGLERSPITAKLLDFACLPLTALVTYEMTRRYFRSASPWLAVALFTSIPIVIWEATTANVDLPLTFHATLAIYGCLRYLERRSWQWLFMATLNVGLAMATKHLGLFLLAAIGPPFAMLTWRAEKRLSPAVIRCMVLCLGGLLVPLPWYVRSWQASGNPVFPELFEVFGARPSERWDPEAERGLRNVMNKAGTPKTMIATVQLPWDLTMHPSYYNSFGPAFLATIPALLLVKRRRQMIFFLSASALLYGMLWAMPHSSRQIRFLLPVTSAIAILAAVAFREAHFCSPATCSGVISCRLMVSVNESCAVAQSSVFLPLAGSPEIPLSVVMGLETPGPPFLNEKSAVLPGLAVRELASAQQRSSTHLQRR